MARESLGCSVHLWAPTLLSTHHVTPEGPQHRGPPIPGQHGVAPVVVKEPKAVAGAKGHEVPLGVEGDSSDSGGGHALHQHAGLEAGGEVEGPIPGGQAVVALPGEALAVLQQVHGGHADRML